jgi:hypothetical protein
MVSPSNHEVGPTHIATTLPFDKLGTRPIVVLAVA